MKARQPYRSGPALASVRGVKPQEPLTRRQRILLSSGLLLTLLLLSGLAYGIHLWQARTAEEATAQPSPRPAASSATDVGSADLADVIGPAALSRGSHLVVGTIDPILRINPLYADSQTERDAAALIFESLLQIDPAGNPVLELAAAESFDPSARQVRFTLRDDHFFNDGSKVTAADVVHTYRLLLADTYDGPLKPYLSAIRGVQADDSGDVIFQLTDSVVRPDPAWFTVGILQASACPVDWTKVYELGVTTPLPSGSGAFRLREMAGGSAVLERRPGFAGAITQIEFRLIESSEQYALLQNGQLDLTYVPFDERYQNRLASLPGYGCEVFDRVCAYVLSGQSPVVPETSGAAGSAQPCLTCLYYEGIDAASAAENLAIAKASLQSMAGQLPDLSFAACNWPELASRALEGRFDLMVLPVTANERLPASCRIAASSSAGQSISSANTLPGMTQESALLYSRRLSQITFNPQAMPLSAAPFSWTDRVENIRLLPYSAADLS